LISDLNKPFLKQLVFLLCPLQLIFIVDRYFVLLLHDLIDHLLLVEPKPVDRLVSLQLQLSVLFADGLQSLEIFTCQVVCFILPRVRNLGKFYFFFGMKMSKLFTAA